MVYQIYPLSFKDTKGNGRGDLKGIIDKLDYLNGTDRSLGVDAIWLNPIYPSPKKDHGYDVADYYAIDPELGDMETFDLLIQEANARNIKIIMDYVLNHTSSEHPWFQESRSSKNSPRSDWYIWLDPKPDGSAPNNWVSVFGGPAWTFDETRGQYYMHSFLSDQPDLNWRNPEVVEEMKNVLRFWMDRGVSGFRADAIEHLFKDSEFRDEPVNPHHDPNIGNPYNALIHTYSRNQRSEILRIINEIDEILSDGNQGFMISETWLCAEDLLEYHKASKGKACLPSNLNILGMPWQVDVIKNYIDRYDSILGNDHCPNYVFSNHDVSRIVDRLGKSKAKAVATLQLTLRGIPFIYYGAELGMGGAQIPPEEVQDPWEKQVPGLGINRDSARTPMQWDDGPYAGFSDVEPWLPLCDDYREVNVKKQLEDPDSVLNLYRSLIAIRRSSRALIKGRYQPLESGNENVLSYIREIEDEKLLVTINFSDNEAEVHIDIPGSEIILSTNKNRKLDKLTALDGLVLEGNEGCIFKLQ